MGIALLILKWVTTLGVDSGSGYEQDYSSNGSMEAHPRHNRLLDLALFIGFVVKHPFHHSFAVVFEGDNAETR